MIANISGIKTEFSALGSQFPDPDAATLDSKNMQKPRNICINPCNTLV